MHKHTRYFRVEAARQEEVEPWDAPQERAGNPRDPLSHTCSRKFRGDDHIALDRGKFQGMKGEREKRRIDGWQGGCIESHFGVA